jgi:tRNA dimethylallyltransferase
MQLSLKELQARLFAIDPRAQESIDIRNPRRVLRAVEICQLSGKPLRDLYSQKKDDFAFPVRGWLLLREREILHKRIFTRVKQMWEQGVVQEIEKVQDIAGATASRAIGFATITAFLRGDMDAVTCQEVICQATRQYAKRQVTWFRHQTAFTPVYLSSFQSSDWDVFFKKSC